MVSNEIWKTYGAKAVEANPDYIRGTHMIQNQFHTVKDMVVFWKMFGPSYGGPWPEKTRPDFWTKDLPDVL